MARGYAKGTYIPIRFHNGNLLVWCKTGQERGLPYYQLKLPNTKEKILQFPMGGNSKGCIQDMSNPTNI